jgi:hypothetical protein
VVILEFLPALCFDTEFMKILAGFSILSVPTSKDIHFGVIREHTHAASWLRKRVSSIGDRDPVLRLGVQGVEVVVIISSSTPLSTKKIEGFLDDITSMIDSFTWWITCSFNSLEG